MSDIGTFLHNTDKVSAPPASVSHETLTEPVVVTSSDDEAVTALASFQPERRSSSGVAHQLLIPLPIDNCM